MRGSHLGALALGTGALGAFLAVTHPTQPAAALALLVFFTGLSAVNRWAWPVVVPAGLPVLNFAPWTGWTGAQEFDLLLLGSVSGGLARLWLWDSPSPASSAAAPAGRWVGATRLWIAGWVLGAVLALWLGWPRPADNEATLQPPWAGAALFKGTVGACLLWPLIVQAVSTDAARTVRRVTTGAVIGLVGMLAMTLWERAAHPGLLDLSDQYRTVGPFWEMHVGGAAIDVYLVAMLPIVLWLLWSQGPTARWWVGAAVLPVLAYAMLTTFSRGVYAAAAGSLLCLGAVLVARHAGGSPARRVRLFVAGTAASVGTAAALAWAFSLQPLAGGGLALLAALALITTIRWRRMPWRPAANLLLTLAVVVEVAALAGASDFLAARVETTAADMSGRLAHWRRHLELLDGARAWGLGIGAGRRAEAYARAHPALGFAGEARWVAAASPHPAHATLLGPEPGTRHGGLHALTQRVALLPAGYEVAVTLRSPTPSHLSVTVCEMHLLYARRCQGTWVHADASWRHARVGLEGPALSAGPGWAPRMAVLSLASPAPGSQVDIAALSLVPRGQSDGLLMNADFSAGRAHWFELTQGHFLPWHADNLYLEVLVEQGLLGLATGVTGWVAALWMLLRRPREGGSFGPFLASSIVAILLIGVVSSVLDVARTGFLFFLLVLLAAALASFGRPPPPALPRTLSPSPNERPA